jgi:hypothetical protein
MIDDIISTLRENRWQVDTIELGAGVWGELLKALPLFAGPPASLYGFPVALDPTLPPDAIEFRYGENVVGRIENVSNENPNKQTPKPPLHPPSQMTPRPPFTPEEIELPIYIDGHLVGKAIVTGPTTRLPTICRACGDTLPPGATFCISCGGKV